MSDIDIKFPVWFDVVVLLMMAIWPLTAAAIAAGVGLWYGRKYIVVRVLAGIVIGLWLISAAMNLYGYIDNVRSERAYNADLKSRQQTLEQATTVSGIALPAGALVTVRSAGTDRIQELDLPSPAVVHGMPLTGHAEFNEDGKIDGYVTLARDATIETIPCSPAGKALFRDGALVECTLSKPTRIRGVPCTGVVDVDTGVECTLFADYRNYGVTWRAQTKVQDLRIDHQAWFYVGPLPPTLRVLGAALPNGAVVSYENGRLKQIGLGVGFSGTPPSYRGCALDSIDVRENGTMVGRPRSACALPTRAGGTLDLPR